MKAKSSPNHKKSGGGTWVGIFIGLVLGIVIATGVVWYTNETPVPFRPRVQPAPITDANRPPVTLPGKPGDPPPAQQPSQPLASIQPPGGPTAQSEAAINSSVARTETPAAQERPFYFQAGSFSQPQEADRLKARLAMMGLEADVQQVMVQNRTFYRLRLGPYAKDRADSVRAELAQEGIETAFIGKE
jgi:cell division protein FtsN